MCRGESDVLKIIPVRVDGKMEFATLGDIDMTKLKLPISDQANVFATGALTYELLKSAAREPFEKKIKEMIPEFDMMEYCEWLRTKVCED